MIDDIGIMRFWAVIGTLFRPAPLVTAYRSQMVTLLWWSLGLDVTCDGPDAFTREFTAEWPQYWN